MDNQLEAIKRAFMEYQPSASDGWFIEMWIFSNISSDNVQAVLRLLAEHEGLNHLFWSMVNRAPTTEKGWSEIGWIGSKVDDEVIEGRRQRFRQAVEAVRNHLGSGQTLRNELFRGRHE